MSLRPTSGSANSTVEGADGPPVVPDERDPLPGQPGHQGVAAHQSGNDPLLGLLADRADLARDRLERAGLDLLVQGPAELLGQGPRHEREALPGHGLKRLAQIQPGHEY
jgi:hypothetical protein